MANRIKTLKDAVQKAIDDGAKSAEEVYMRISRMPFDQLERIAAIEGIVRKARGVHDQSIGRLYDTIRAINKRVGKLSDQMLARLGLAQARRRRRAPSRRRRKAP